MAALRTLLVYPNPYLHIDAAGRPCAIVPYETKHRNDVHSSKRFVGMALKVAAGDKATTSAQQDMQETSFEVLGDDPVTVEDTPYYAKCLRDGELIAADLKTSRRAGQMKFIEPGQALAAEKAKAQKALKDLAHEDHDDEIHAALAAHAFGPMKGSAKPAPSKAPEAK